MTSLGPTRRRWHLGVTGWLYVVIIGVLASASALLNAIELYVSLLALTVPTGFLGLYAGLWLMSDLGRLFELDPDGRSWLLGVVWVVVWLASAWANAKLVQLCWRNGRLWLAARGAAEALGQEAPRPAGNRGV